MIRFRQQNWMKGMKDADCKLGMRVRVCNDVHDWRRGIIFEKYNFTPPLYRVSCDDGTKVAAYACEMERMEARR